MRLVVSVFYFPCFYKIFPAYNYTNLKRQSEKFRWLSIWIFTFFPVYQRCWKSLSQQVVLTLLVLSVVIEVHMDILAEYKIWQSQLIFGRFCTNQWGAEKVRIDGIWEFGQYLSVWNLSFFQESLSLCKLKHSNLGHMSFQFLYASSFCW